MPPAGKRKLKLRGAAADSVAADGVAVEQEVPVAPEVPSTDADELPELSSGVTLEKMCVLTRELRYFIEDNWDPEMCNELLGILTYCKGYEDLLVGLLLENERLRGRLEVLTSNSYTAKVATAAVKAAVKAVRPIAVPAAKPAAVAAVTAAAPAATPAAMAAVAAPAAIPAAVVAAAAPAAKPAAVPAAIIAAAAPAAVPAVAAAAVSAVAVPAAVAAVFPKFGMQASRPEETWSVVVRGKNCKSAREVVEKVVEEVGPTLGVRVHDIRPTRDGGALIRTPTMAEREKVVRNAKFKEVGLDVAVNEKAGPRVVIRGVHTSISVEEFMAELYEMNLKEVMDPEKYKRSVRLISKPWSEDTAKQVDVVIAGDEMVMRRLLDVGRVYIKWFSFRTRLQDSVPHCFRCLGFDHRVRECRMRDDVCRNCGAMGHMAPQCNGAVNCRDCAFKGLPADHRMLTYRCPIYAALAARANARH